METRYKVVRFDGKTIGVFSSMEEINSFWCNHFGHAFCHATGYKAILVE